MKKYGKSDRDIHAEKMFQCRQIVKEIIDFGVTENQKKQIIKLIALELEDNSLMKEIVESLRSERGNSSKKLIYTE
jgi:hypothetical protein